MATSLTAPNINAPQMVPGGQFSDLFEQDLRGDLQAIINDLVETVNNLELTVNNLSIVNGTGGGVRPMTIGYTTPGRNNTSLNDITRGGENLQLHSSGQLIVAWKEYSGAGNLYEIMLKKAVAPYTTWTNLAGDSQEPTVLAPSFTMASSTGLTIAEETVTGYLHVFVSDSAAGNPKQYAYAFDGENFALSVSNNTISTFADIFIGDVIATRDYLVMLEHDGNHPGIILTAPIASPTSWGEIVKYNAIYYGGSYFGMTNGADECRLIDLGDGRVLALFEAVGASGDYNIIWSMSYDYGATWPVGDPGTGTAQEIGTPGQASGTMFPQTGAASWATATLMSSGAGGQTFATWNAAHIAGTSRVGLTFLAKPNPFAGTEPSGVMYAEFDADTLTWTAQDDMVRLTPTNMGSETGTGNSVPLRFVANGTSYTGCAGKCVCGSDGVVRVFWLHGHNTAGSENDRIRGIHYRRLALGADAEDTSMWHAEREAVLFHNEMAINDYNIAEFTGCKQGLVMVGDISYFPVMWVERNYGATLKGMTYAEIRFALLPVALLDLP